MSSPHPSDTPPARSDLAPPHLYPSSPTLPFYSVPSAAPTTFPIFMVQLEDFGEADKGDASFVNRNLSVFLMYLP